jgi:hypothetical protein
MPRRLNKKAPNQSFYYKSVIRILLCYLRDSFQSNNQYSKILQEFLLNDFWNPHNFTRLFPF